MTEEKSGDPHSSPSNEQTLVKPAKSSDLTVPQPPKGADILEDDATVHAALPEDKEGKQEHKSNANFSEVPQQTEPERIIDIGSVINNRFVIDAELGRGGMGVVYRALDKRKEEAQDRDPYVAIKILGKEFRHHPHAFIALQREARKSQTLAHPNIITVYDFDRDGDIVYMTMEELSGLTLEQYIKDHPRGVATKKALKIITSIAKALAYAHSNKIVHSDLKPGNIFVSESGQVKILDFGIARAAAAGIESSQGDQTVFDAGELGGLTPTYASLEMFRGEEPHSGDDLYALGLISYELLTGLHPYQRKPADKALKEKIRPSRIKGLKPHHWWAVAATIEIPREKRLCDADLFLKKIAGVSTTTKGLAAALVILLVISTSLILLQKPDTGPEIAFTELPQEAQEIISESLSSGEEALKYGDLNGALYYFNTIHELHPKNPDAEAGLEQIVEAVLDTIDMGSEKAQLLRNVSQIDTLLAYPSLVENKDLLKAKDALEDKLSD